MIQRMCSVRTICDLAGTRTGHLPVIVPEVWAMEFVGQGCSMVVVGWKLMRGLLRRMLHALPGRSCMAPSGTGRTRVEGVIMMMMMMMPM